MQCGGVQPSGVRMCPSVIVNVIRLQSTFSRTIRVALEPGPIGWAGQGSAGQGAAGVLRGGGAGRPAKPCYVPFAAGSVSCSGAAAARCRQSTCCPAARCGQ